VYLFVKLAGWVFFCFFFFGPTSSIFTCSISINQSNPTPNFYKNYKDIKFDFIFIDGGHDYETAKSDLENCYHLAHKDTIVIVDDIVHVPGWSAGWTIEPTKIWEEGKKFNEIVELGRVVDRPGIGLAWGKYLKSFELDGVFHTLPDLTTTP
jgi:hypothetical protein